MSEHDNPPTERNDGTDPFDDGSEDGWLEQRYPAVSADFVDRTLARVMRDRTEIEHEARQVEDIRLDPDLLQTLVPPEPSADFVERTLARVVAQRHDQDSRDHVLRELIRHYEVPQASPDFVPRTLSALGLDQGTPAAAAAVLPLRRRALRWAAAAVLLVGLPLVVASPWSGSGPAGPRKEEPAAQLQPVDYPLERIFTTGRWGAAMANKSNRWGYELGSMPLQDAEVTLAHLATHAAGNGR